MAVILPACGIEKASVAKVDKLISPLGGSPIRDTALPNPIKVKTLGNPSEVVLKIDSEGPEEKGMIEIPEVNEGAGEHVASNASKGPILHLLLSDEQPQFMELSSRILYLLFHQSIQRRWVLKGYCHKHSTDVNKTVDKKKYKGPRLRVQIVRG
ncbi:hypothetical protein [Lysinibacillus xylanilyticus]|uniref:hypothetical protein n=1 Tax=Lysinibacillus xylanilyticus TaxID=582475 RepID=UPI0037F90C95